MIPKTMLQVYQIEFETTDISLEQLCVKYKLDPADLTNSEKWVKKLPSLSHSKPLAGELITEEEDEDEDTDIQANIEEIKKVLSKKMVDLANSINNFTDVKEVKELMMAVKTLEESTKSRPPERGVVVIVQNIIKEYPDDC